MIPLCRPLQLDHYNYILINTYFYVLQLSLLGLFWEWNFSQSIDTVVTDDNLGYKSFIFSQKSFTIFTKHFITLFNIFLHLYSFLTLENDEYSRSIGYHWLMINVFEQDKLIEKGNLDNIIRMRLPVENERLRASLR